MPHIIYRNELLSMGSDKCELLSMFVCVDEKLCSSKREKMSIESSLHRDFNF